MDKAALFKLSYGLYIIGVKDGDKQGGCVVNTAMQVTSKPAKVSLTVSKDNHTHDMMMASKHCTVSVLAQNVSMDTVGGFGFRSSKDVDKFDGVAHKMDEQGTPYLTDGMVAYFSCDITDTVDLGSHTLFVANVVEGEVLEDAEPMTYSYYRHVKNGTVPKNAPTYREEEPAQAGYKCSVCGHVETLDTLPEDYRCPICRQPKGVFNKL